MKRDYKLFINDIRESIVRIENYLKNVSEHQFMSDTKLQDAVIRRLEIIGEASRNIPRSLKEKNPQVSWQRIEHFRDVVIHSYFSTSLDRIWMIVSRELKEIKESMKKIRLV